MTNTDINTFTFGSAPLRVVTINDEPWFVMKDVMKPLGLSGYPSHHTYRLGKYETTKVTRNSHSLTVSVIETLFKTQSSTITLISESGLYKIVMRSDKPEALKFQNWVTQDVLPAIRKDGMYVQGEEKVATGEMSEDELIAKAMGLLSKKVERLTKVTDNHIKSVCIKTYCGLRREHLSKSDTMKVVSRAKKIMIANEMPIPKITMKVGGLC